MPPIDNDCTNREVLFVNEKAKQLWGSLTMRIRLDVSLLFVLFVFQLLQTSSSAASRLSLAGSRCAVAAVALRRGIKRCNNGL